jgi:hypothetical protein
MLSPTYWQLVVAVVVDMAVVVLVAFFIPLHRYWYPEQDTV